MCDLSSSKIKKIKRNNGCRLRIKKCTAKKNEHISFLCQILLKSLFYVLLRINSRIQFTIILN